MEYIIPLLLFLVFSIFYFVFNLGAFFTAMFSNVDIGFGEYISWKLKKLNHVRLTRSLIVIHKLKLNISKQEVLSMEESNINSTNVLSPLLVAKRLNVDFPITLAIQGDKEDIDFNLLFRKSDNHAETLNSLKDQLSK